MDWTYAWVAGGVVILVIAWKRLTLVSADAARKHLATGARVIDVRSPEEFEAGHLPVAVNVPLGELREGLPRVAPDKSQVLLLHCLSGTRSGIARRLLKGMGYPHVFNLGSYHRARRIVSRNRSQ